jgi:ribosomal protein S18 acetylase RimI-like enzyme
MNNRDRILHKAALTGNNPGIKALLNRGLENIDPKTKEFIRDKNVEYKAEMGRYNTPSSVLSIGSDKPNAGGFVRITPTADEQGDWAHISNLYTAPEDRGKGYGKALLALALKIYSDRPVYLRRGAFELDDNSDVVSIDDKERNKRLDRLYTSIGFKKDKSERDLGNYNIYSPFESLELNSTEYPLYKFYKKSANNSIDKQLSELEQSYVSESRRNLLAAGHMLAGAAAGFGIGGGIGAGLGDQQAATASAAIGGLSGMALVALAIGIGALKAKGSKPNSAISGWDVINPYLNARKGTEASANVDRLAQKIPTGIVNKLEDAEWSEIYRNNQNKHNTQPLWDRLREGYDVTDIEPLRQLNADVDKVHKI